MLSENKTKQVAEWGAQTISSLVFKTEEKAKDKHHIRTSLYLTRTLIAVAASEGEKGDVCTFKFCFLSVFSLFKNEIKLK